MVPVMLRGGRNDGQIMQVESNGDGVTPKLTHVFMKRPPQPAWSRKEDSNEIVENQKIVVPITPRKADAGPAWEIVLPKELW